MDENEKQQLQEELTNALISGDADKQREVEGKINSFLGAPPPAPEEKEAVPEAVEAKGEVAKEDGTEGKEAPSLPEKAEEDKAAQPTASEVDWLDSLDPAIRKHAEQLLEDKKRLEHRLKTDDGRVAAYQRRYHESTQLNTRLKEEINDLKSKTAPQTPAAKKDTTREIDEDLKAVLETDEQLGRTLMREREKQEAHISALEQKLAEFEKRLDPIQSSNEEAEVQRELSTLRSYISNADEILASRAFREFVETAPPAVQALAKSSYADEVAAAIQLYVPFAENYNRAYTQPTSTVDQTKVEAIQKERDRKLQAQPVGSAAIKPPTKTEPTLQDLVANPDLRRQEQERIFKEEMKKLGMGS